MCARVESQAGNSANPGERWLAPTKPPICFLKNAFVECAGQGFLRLAAFTRARGGRPGDFLLRQGRIFRKGQVFLRADECLLFGAYEQLDRFKTKKQKR